MVLRRKALRGTGDENQVLMSENVWWNGMARSRANAHVAREAAQRIEIAQNIPQPKTSRDIKQGQVGQLVKAHTNEDLQKKVSNTTTLSTSRVRLPSRIHQPSTPLSAQALIQWVVQTLLERLK